MKNRISSKSKKTHIQHKGRSKESFYNRYARERDEFFIKHKNSRILIGALIIAFSLHLGGLIHKTSENYISQVLSAEGIPYPVDESPVQILGVSTQE